MNGTRKCTAAAGIVTTHVFRASREGASQALLSSRRGAVQSMQKTKRLPGVSAALMGSG